MPNNKQIEEPLDPAEKLEPVAGPLSGGMADLGAAGDDAMRDRNRAILNILDDVADSERNLRRKTVELEKFRQAADESFDHVIITDAEGVILYANNAVTEITGFTNKEAVGHSASLWGGKMSKEFYADMWHTIREEKKRYVGEVTNHKKNGQIYLASVRISPILGADGGVRFFVGVERDITEEREAQLRVVKHSQELQKERDRAESILRFLKSIGDGVVATDMEGRIIFFNEAAEKLTGVASEKATGNYAWETMWYFRENDPATQIKVVKIFLAGEDTFNKTRDRFMLKRKDGAVASVAFSISMMFNTQKEKQGCILVMRDVSEERELEKTKDNFLSVAAHQLRTPLSGIRWNLEMLLDGDAGELSAEAGEIIKNMDENTQRLVVLVNDLLDVSRINMGKTDEEAVPINICKMLNEAAAGLQGLISERGVHVSFENACSLNPTVKAPPKHLFQAFENLLSNAVKYTPNGGEVSVLVDYKKDEVLIKVVDNGIGIPEKDQEKIFTKFFRAGNAVLKETEGSGLGLNVVKSYIEEAGGKIWFESAEGKGTTFFISLPNYKAE